MDREDRNGNTDRENVDKVERVLGIYSKLIGGEIVNKAAEAARYHVNERSIQRDIDSIRNFMEQQVADSGVVNEVIYDRSEQGYRLEKLYQLQFSNSEILAICKILLDSRAFTKKEMTVMLDKLLDCCVPKSNQKLVRELISNEEYHYIEPQHRTRFIDQMWEIGQAIQRHQYIEIEYKGMKSTDVKKRKLQPLAIMFSEYYFYLAAFIDDEKVREKFSVANDAYPTIYRIDRIRHLHVLGEQFRVPYTSRFEEGEFRKRIQFMYGGRLRKIRFRYTGYSIEAILDRLPTARIERVDQDEMTNRTVYTVSAEVFGDGVDMWLRSQGENVEVVR